MVSCTMSWLLSLLDVYSITYEAKLARLDLSVWQQTSHGLTVSSR